MTDSTKLREIIKSKGIKMCFLAEKLGLSRTGFQKKMDNEIEFKPSEISLLCELLGITTLSAKNDIFFCLKVDK